MYHNIRASQGFLELGDPDSAWEELELIPAEERAHPVVLRMRVYIYREKARWMEMAEMRIRKIQVQHKPNIRFIDSHPESIGRHHHPRGAIHPFMLLLSSQRLIQSGVVKVSQDLLRT